MEINPQRVRSAEFQKVRKGLDPDEVQTFLNDVADELERAQNQSAAMEARARAAVARLQELSDAGADVPRAEPAPAPAQVVQAPTAVEASVEESETISRTMLLAQRTADTTVAEARAEAAQLVARAEDDAQSTLESTRERSESLIAEARGAAREVGESERLIVAGEVDALMARRDFLESDVDHLETFVVDQRARVRDVATALVDLADRVQGGLGDVRRPLLSAADDEVGGGSDHDATGNEGGPADEESPQAVDEVVAVVAVADGLVDDEDGSGDVGDSTDELDTESGDAPELVIATDIADTIDAADDADLVDDDDTDANERDPWAEITGQPRRTDDDAATMQMTAVEPDSGDSDDDDSDGDEFRFSFDGDRR